MDSSPGSKNGRRESRLLNTNVRYEERNEADEKFEWQFSLVMAKINGFSEKESLDNLIALSNVDKASFENCCAGLVYAFLVDPERANKAL
ncbi:hypothetical protein QR680_009137 [Steinernema hermaphroditum]|uniref:Uncharacterized protein n=1 Tax=Steinernema hermaphroditum TaxID=289476 RepID=A0AA39M8W0_9BILA|nr:hypothetical protein QR680_009137 [Steinernema hermaphroditum]